MHLHYLQAIAASVAVVLALPSPSVHEAGHALSPSGEPHTLSRRSANLGPALGAEWRKILGGGLKGPWLDSIYEGKKALKDAGDKRPLSEIEQDIRTRKGKQIAKEARRRRKQNNDPRSHKEIALDVVDEIIAAERARASKLDRDKRKAAKEAKGEAAKKKLEQTSATNPVQPVAKPSSQGLTNLQKAQLAAGAFTGWVAANAVNVGGALSSAMTTVGEGIGLLTSAIAGTQQ